MTVGRAGQQREGESNYQGLAHGRARYRRRAVYLIMEGDQVVFRVEGGRAVIARTPDLLDLAGAVRVPAGKRGAPWDEVIRETRKARAHRRP